MRHGGRGPAVRGGVCPKDRLSRARRLFIRERIRRILFVLCKRRFFTAVRICRRLARDSEMTRVQIGLDGVPGISSGSTRDVVGLSGKGNSSPRRLKAWGISLSRRWGKRSQGSRKKPSGYGGLSGYLASSSQALIFSSCRATERGPVPPGALRRATAAL